MTGKLKIFIGYDSREDIAWQVCRFSLLRHTNADIEIYPLKQKTLREVGLYTRGTDNASTEFSLTRFLTPYLGAHDGYSIFVDCDFLFTTDIMSVLDGVDPGKAVYVVKHDYTPANAVKMDAQAQTSYPRKNWSSFILFNNAHPQVKALTPDVVNTQSPAFLHRFNWIDDDEYEKPEGVPSAIHYTNGGPWFSNWQNVDYGDLWTAERDLYEESLRAEKSA